MLKMKSVLRPQHNQENDTVGMLFHAVVTNWKSRVRDILGALPGLVIPINPLSPGLKLQILLLCFHTFHTKVVGRICLNINRI